MSNQLIELSGDPEPASDTIRKFLADHYSQSFNCMFISEGGIDASSKRLTTTDIKLLDKEAELYVKCYDGSTRIIESSNSFVYVEESVIVRIHGKHEQDRQSKMRRVRDDIEQTVFRYIKGPFPKSHDGLASGVLQLSYRYVEWTNIPEDNESGISEHIEGEIWARYQRSRQQ